MYQFLWLMDSEGGMLGPQLRLDLFMTKQLYQLRMLSIMLLLEKINSNFIVNFHCAFSDKRVTGYGREVF